MFKNFELDVAGKHFEGNQVAVLGSIIVFASLYIFRKYAVVGKSCNIRKDLTGKVAVITGGNTGIGK